ncbi:unnamed protein product, partial [Choristocarpus tenellus]
LLLWHHRLAHLNDRDLHRLKTQHPADLTFPTTEHLPPCSSCAMNKSTLQPHSKIPTTARQLLEVVHSDVTGPVSPPSFSGSRYAVIYTDSATRMRRIYFIRSKSGVFNTLRRYRTNVTANTGYRIKTLRSDTGGEYTGRDISTYCTHHNIRQEFTNPYSSQDNGLAERQWRTIFPKARSILISQHGSTQATLD